MGDVPDEAACTRDSLDIQSRLYAEYARGNRAAVFEALAEDVAWHSVASDGIPWGGSHRGRDGVESYFSRLDSAARVVGFDVERVIAQDEWITALVRVRVRFPATGTEREFAAANILRVRGGRVAEFREFYDTASVLEAMRRPRAA
jgi:ketosteroid isomerase-like protein